MDFSDYIIYVDESGDHSLTSIDAQYPIFVLIFCLFKKSNYHRTMQAIHEFKFAHFGHDMAILHESDIRRDRGAFRFLKTKALKAAFTEELGNIIKAANLTVIATVIDKNQLTSTHGYTENPYHIALKRCMEQANQWLQVHQQHKKLTHIVCERRGSQEDNELISAFHQINSGHNDLDTAMAFDIVMAHKQCNSTGLQLADLLARPIGLSVIKPQQVNRAFEIIVPKLYCSRGEKKGNGITLFPALETPTPENKKP